MSIDRVGGSGPITPQNQVRRTRHAGGAGFASLVAEGDSGESTAVTGTAPAGSLDALLSLQQIDADANPQKRGRKKAEDMLRGLEKLRDDLLLGQISPTTLHQLQNQLDQQIGDIMDPRLKDIIDDISLRVAVELAKWQRHNG